MKKPTAIMLGLLLTASVVSSVYAATSDQITITITPSVTLNVVIATATVKWNSGDTDMDLTLSLGTTDYLIKPATVTYTGTFANAELEVQGTDNMTTWAFDDDGTATENELQVYVLFGDTSATTAPTVPTHYTDGTGGAGDQVTTTMKHYGLVGTDDGTNNSQYQNSSYSSASENLNSSNERHMWIRVDVPPTSTSSAQQDFSIVLTATQNN